MEDSSEDEEDKIKLTGSNNNEKVEQPAEKPAAEGKTKKRVSKAKYKSCPED
jgi:hypothetical protein